MTIHTGENFKCIQCNKSFSYEANMKKHFTKHTGEKKHKCAQCDKGFDLASGLKLHNAHVDSQWGKATPLF